MQAFISNDNLLEVIGLQNAKTGEYINASATVQATLKDRAGANVTGASWPLALSYVAASNGNWDVVLPAALDLTDGQDYVCEITAQVSGGPTAAWSAPVTAIKRTS